MTTSLFAGTAAFDLEQLKGLIPHDLQSQIEEKVGGNQLRVARDGNFVAQIQPCSEEEDEDTRADMGRVADQSAEFATGLSEGTLRFLIVTSADAEQASLQRAIDAFVGAGLVQFDCGDGVRKLTP